MLLCTYLPWPFIWTNLNPLHPRKWQDWWKLAELSKFQNHYQTFGLTLQHVLSDWILFTFLNKQTIYMNCKLYCFQQHSISYSMKKVLNSLSISLSDCSFAFSLLLSSFTTLSHSESISTLFLDSFLFCNGIICTTIRC